MSRNLLDQETSPYLLLHKDNPVHWRPWGQAAFEEAETTGKPILLSIGYTACHWCHVMNEESFGDPDVAAVMNENFINIKVDREERPDIDQIYQTAATALGHARRLAAHHVPHAARRAFRRGRLFPEGRPRRRTGVQTRAAGSRASLQRTARADRQHGRARADGVCAIVGPRPARSARRHRRRCRRRQMRAALRHLLRRHHGDAEIPDDRSHRNAVARLSAHRRGAIRAARADHARQHLPRRSLRSHRRRLLSLLRRRTLVHAAFREDALRQRADGRSPDARLPAQSPDRIMSIASKTRSAGSSAR